MKKKFFSSIRTFTRDFAIASFWLATRLTWFPKFHYSGGKRVKRVIKGNALVICNHATWFDPPVLCTFFPFRRVSVVTAKELFSPQVAKSLETLGCIRMDRDMVDIKCIRRCLELLKNGQVVSIFPEGKLNFEDNIQKFKPGAAMLAAMSKAPVIPMYIAGNYRPFQRLQVIFGQPISYSELSDSVNVNRINEMTELLHSRMVELKSELEGKMKKKHLDTARARREKLRASQAAKEKAQEGTENG